MEKKENDGLSYEARQRTAYNPKTKRIGVTYRNSGGYGKPYPVDVSQNPNEVTLKEYNDERAKARENVAGYAMQKTVSKRTMPKKPQEEGSMMRTKTMVTVPKKPSEEENDSTETESNFNEQEKALKKENMFGL